MTDNFQKISIEKQQRILNAALEVFAKNGYKRASTAAIAEKAGIAKGLLFHYFKNKYTLYFYLYDYGVDIVTKEIESDDAFQTSDFFLRLEKATMKKFVSMKQHPFIYSFFIKVYLEDDVVVKDELMNRLSKLTRDQRSLLEHIDMSKFRKQVDLNLLCNMIVNFSVELIQSMLLRNPDVDMEIMVKESQKYMDMLKENFYKEEYL